MGWFTKIRFNESPLTGGLVFFALLSIVIVAVLSHRGVDVREKLDSAYAYYFGAPAQQQQDPADDDREPVEVLADNSANAEQSTVAPERLLHEEETTDVYRIALHPLSDSQYRLTHADGPEISELISSLLLIELGKGDRLELLDRSMVSALFAEKSNVLVNDYQRFTQADFEKIPVSEFSLTGSLFSSGGEKSYGLKLVRNRTGDMIGARRFPFTLDTLDESVQEALVFVQESLAVARLKTDNYAKNTIAFGHFVDISQSDSELNQGRDITERLIAKYVNEKGFSVLSRTQTFPLLFEELLRLLQYTDENQESLRRNPSYLVHGKYKVNPADSNRRLSIYLYIDLIEQGRELLVLHADDWDEAYELVDNAISSFIPDPGWQISEANREQSQKLFLEALRARGMLHSEPILSGKAPPSENDIKSFSSSYKPEHLTAARDYIERSLNLNPHNQLSRMAMAMYLETEGDSDASKAMLEEAKRSQDDAIADIAYKILASRRSKAGSPIGSDDFEPIAGAELAEKIFQALLEEGYMRDAGGRIMVNGESKSEQIYNRPHALPLADLDTDITIQAYEKLRTFHYRPGTQIRFVKPRNFHPRNASNKRNWYQSAYRDKHNIEAILHSDMARTAGNIHINDATDLPSIEFYPEAKRESANRRRSNLEVAIDGFSSSAYLDTSYLKALILLGHSLCQAEIDQCAAGNMIHSWVVNHTRPVNLKGRGGMYFNVSEDVERKDRLIFLAADAVDRVSEANITELFQHTLVRENYFVRKKRKRLDRILTEVGRPVPAHQINRVVDAYAGIIAAHCTQFRKRRRDLTDPRKYLTTMDEIAKLAMQSNKAASLLQTLLADSELACPDVYPYLMVQTRVTNPFVITQQTDVIKRVSVGDTVPYNPSEFMEIAVQLFEARIDAGDLETARQYLQYLADFYGITDRTAMDFAYLYHRVGDAAMSEKLLRDYGRMSFEIRNFSLSNIDGVYTHRGFDARGELKFFNENDENVYITYRAVRKYLGLGEQSIKWRLYRHKKSHSGNRHGSNPELFAFGNGGRFHGDRTWSSHGLENTDTRALTAAGVGSRPAIGSERTIEVKAPEKDDSNTDERTLEALMMGGYAFSANQQSAIRGLPYKATTGPLLTSYFSDSFSRNRKISVVQEKLFEHGYLSVSGMPVFSNGRELLGQLKRDLPDYSELEIRGLRDALMAATKVSGAGYAEIYEDDGNSWSLASTLVPEDAVESRHFGIAVAIHEHHALVCDYKDGLYSFTKTNSGWVSKNRLDSRCSNVTMNGDWAIVASTEKVIVYRNNNGSWEVTQSLIPVDYLVRKENRQSFEYFGASMAILEDTILIGNLYGGKGRNGEVYVFNLSGNEWRHSQILLPNSSARRFGKTIAATNQYIAVGDPGTGDLDTPEFNSGSVFLYAREKSGWQMTAQLVPEGRPKGAEFGRRVLLNNEEEMTLLIQSKDDVFRYDISAMVEMVGKAESSEAP